MNTHFYLLNLEIAGIKNIEKPIVLNFYKKTIANDFESESHKIKAVYGENGSGKTAIILAVKLLQNLILKKSFLSDSTIQNILSESVNKKTRSGHIGCEFYFEESAIKTIGRYYISFEIKSDNRFYITGEKYEVKNGAYTKNAYVTVYETKEGVLTYLFDSDNYNVFKDMTQNLLSQRAFSTWALEEKLFKDEKIGKTIHHLFDLIQFSLAISVSIDESDNYFERTEKELFFPRFTGGMVLKQLYDLYAEQIDRLCDFLKIFKPELLDISIDRTEQKYYYECNLKMIYEDYSLDSKYESRGIKKLMNLFGYLDAAANGRIVFIDELDSNINDVYLDKIIEHFVYYGKGQLCFTAHNLSPMRILKGRKGAITFISSINTVHTWANTGNANPENAYKSGFIEDSPFNVDASNFLGIIGGEDER